MAKFLLGFVFLYLTILHPRTVADKVEPGDDGRAVGNEAVLTLTPENFTEVVNDKDIILVEFYAPWCGHCKQLAPEYEAAAKILRNLSPPIPLAKVDASTHQSLGSQFGIEGFPTMKVFRKGNAFEYEGPRQANGIVEYMKKQASKGWSPPPDPVVVLTKENFTETVSNSDISLVEFYAPWCGHCKRLAPQYSKAASVLKQTETGIILAKVDATAEPELGKEYGVSGYPTLKIFRRGRVFEYKGPRDAKGIVNYMLQQSEPASQELSNKKELNLLLKGDTAIVVAFLDSDTSPLIEIYMEVANAGREEPLTFLHSFNTALAASFSLEQEVIAVFLPKRDHSKYESAVRKYTGSTEGKSTDDLISELLTLARPLVGFRTKQNGPKLYKVFPLLTAYVSLEDEEDPIEHWKQKLRPVADEYRNITFCLADEKDTKEELQALQLDDKGDDIFIGLWASRTDRYTLRQEDEFSIEDLKDFLDDYKAGKLTRVRRSQPKPRKNDGPVKVVVGDTFQDIVFDPKKDVLVEFYAPWCGHCKQLEPKYKKLGKKYKSNEKLVIAKFDATNNDAPPEFEFSGFPTIFFVPAGAEEGGKPTVYEGARELKDMVEFLENEATFSLGGGEGKDEL